MSEPQITVTERMSGREQIRQILEAAHQAGDPLIRVRIPFTLYGYDTNRNYVAIRDAAWNIQLKRAETSTETVEGLIDTVGRCIVAIAREGSGAVLRKLEMRAPEAEA